jgi:hypothetical protein
MLFVMQEGAALLRQNAVIADSSVARGLVDARRAALLFDQLVVVRTEQSAFDPSAARLADAGVFGPETDWLVERGMVRFENDLADDALAAHDAGYALDRKQVAGAIRNLVLTGSESPEFESWIRCGANGVARSTAAYLQERNDLDHVPLVYGKRHELSRLLPASRPAAPRERHRDDVPAICVLFSALPTPDASTPWEAILEYRADPAAFGAFARLRRWTVEAARSGRAGPELRQRLEWELHGYEDALRLHRIKSRLQTLEALIATPLEIAQNLAAFKWGDAAKALFSVGRKRLELLEAEQRLAARDLHFLVIAKETTGRRRGT